MVDQDQRPLPIENRSASGGLNTRVFPLDLAPDQAVQLQNIETTTPGIRRIRQGYTVAATGITFGPPLALKSLRKSQNNSQVLLCVAPGGSLGDHKQLYEWDGQGTEFSHVGALTGYTADPYSDEGRVEIVVGTDLLADKPYVAIINTGQEGLTRWYYEGSFLTTCSWGSVPADGPTNIPFQVSHSRGFGRGEDATDKNTLYFSDIASFTVTGFIGPEQTFVVGSNSIQEIVAIEEFRQQELVVFLTDRTEEFLIIEGSLAAFNTMYAPVGDVSPYIHWQRRVIDRQIGCGAKESVATQGRDILFMDQRGNVRSVGRTINDAAQGAESLPLSESIDSYIQRINPAAIKNSIGISFDRWYLLGIPLDLAERPTHVFAMDMARTRGRELGVWDGPWINLDPFCWATAALPDATAAADQRETLYFGQNATADGGLVMKMFRGNTDNGEPVVYQEVTRRMDWDRYELFKEGESIDVYAVATGNVTLRIEANTDAVGFELLGDTNVLGNTPALPVTLPFILGGSGVVEGRKDMTQLEKFRDVQFRFTATASEDVQFLGFTPRAFIDNYRPEIDDG